MKQNKPKNYYVVPKWATHNKTTNTVRILQKCKGVLQQAICARGLSMHCFYAVVFIVIVVFVGVTVLVVVLAVDVTV